MTTFDDVLNAFKHASNCRHVRVRLYDLVDKIKYNSPKPSMDQIEITIWQCINLIEDRLPEE